jgi:hypothetical protein
MVSLASLTGPYENELKEPVVFRAIEFIQVNFRPAGLELAHVPLARLVGQLGSRVATGLVRGPRYRKLRLLVNYVEIPPL